MMSSYDVILCALSWESSNKVQLWTGLLLLSVSGEPNILSVDAYTILSDCKWPSNL